ncbi:MAG: SMI1/KNR4 family protein [Candidatus Competibacterales bacterium]
MVSLLSRQHPGPVVLVKLGIALALAGLLLACESAETPTVLRPAPPTAMTIEQWRDFLLAWSREALELVAQAQALDPEYADHSPLLQRALSRGTLVFPGAESEVIAAAETRLGTALPPSYKRFLQASNGFIIVALDVDDALLWPAESLAWLQDGAPDFVDAWRHVGWARDEDYFNYGPDQDVVHIRGDYMPHLLQLSELVEAAVVLLNPKVVSPEGEWEGWDMGNAFPGAHRYQNFEQLMAGLRQRTLANLRDALDFLGRP